MASSTTMPIANTKPNSVKLFKLNPMAAIAVKVPTMATGTAIIGMIDERQLRRNTSTTSATRITASRNVLKKFNLDKAFVHSTGHGLGLEIHEPPRLGKSDKGRLKAGMAITIEPGVYLEGFGGIRIEDTVLVTEKGCEILTPTNKELRVI